MISLFYRPIFFLFYLSSNLLNSLLTQHMQVHLFNFIFLQSDGLTFNPLAGCTVMYIHHFHISLLLFFFKSKTAHHSSSLGDKELVTSAAPS